MCLTTRYTCKVVTGEVFEAVKLALVTSVPPLRLPETLATVIDSQAACGHPTDDLERVWEEAILANAERLAEAAPLPRSVAKRVIRLAYERVMSIAHADHVDDDEHDDETPPCASPK